MRFHRGMADLHDRSLQPYRKLFMNLHTTAPRLSSPLPLPLAATALAIGLLFSPIGAHAQTAGSRAVVSMTLPSSTEPVFGWSIRQGLMGRPIVDDNDRQIGTVVDVLVKDGASPFVLVIGVGGRFEVGGHAVALPLESVVEQMGLLHLPGASQASLKAMPRFTYSTAAMWREQFVKGATVQLAAANAALTQLRKTAALATGSARLKLEQDGATLERAVTRAEDRLADLKKAEIARWTLLQEDVQRAIDDMRLALPLDAPEQAKQAKQATPAKKSH
jgi:hypothetical protein